MSSHFHGQTLSRSDLAALIDGANRTLSECVFDHADVSGLDLNGVRFERCSFKETDFTSAQLENSSFASCRGAMANFTAARLGSSAWKSCDLNNARFTGASLTEAVFTGCKLTGADFSRSRNVGTTFNADLRGADLGGLRLNDARRFKGATISRAQAGALLAELGLRVV